ncbi:MAG: DUF3299 domain-containing protein [Oceanospirillaceae bacterium]
MKKFILVLSCLWAVSVNAQQVTELSWEDLIPETERQLLDLWERQLPTDENFSNPIASELGKVRSNLDGKDIKIAGFVIPLEGDEEQVFEMLLVPYFGACFHVPPPPANQIIHVTFKTGVKIKDLWDVVYVSGKLQTKTSINEFAEVAYSMQGLSIEEYEE